MSPVVGALNVNVTEALPLFTLTAVGGFNVIVVPVVPVVPVVSVVPVGKKSFGNI